MPQKTISYKIQVLRKNFVCKEIIWEFILFVSRFLTYLTWTERLDDDGGPEVKGRRVGDSWPVGDGGPRLWPGFKVLPQSMLAKYRDLKVVLKYVNIKQVLSSEIGQIMLKFDV